MQCRRRVRKRSCAQAASCSGPAHPIPGAHTANVCILVCGMYNRRGQKSPDLGCTIVHSTWYVRLLYCWSTPSACCIIHVYSTVRTCPQPETQQCRYVSRDTALQVVSMMHAVRHTTCSLYLSASHPKALSTSRWRPWLTCLPPSRVCELPTSCPSGWTRNAHCFARRLCSRNNCSNLKTCAVLLF